MATADAVFNVSQFIRQRSISNGCIPSTKSFTIQNGILPISLNVHIRKRERAKLGVDDNTTVIMTTGRAHPYKRFEFILEVANYIKTKHPNLDVKFFIAGDGPQLDELHKIAQDKELASIVKLMGYQSNIRQLLQAGDIAFHASLGEAFSLSIVEYMSANMPVFVPDIPSVCQAIDHMENGCIYPWNDSETAASLLVEIIQDTRILKKMGDVARKKATKVYSLEECSKQFVAIMRLLYERK